MKSIVQFSKKNYGFTTFSLHNIYFDNKFYPIHCVKTWTPTCKPIKNWFLTYQVKALSNIRFIILIKKNGKYPKIKCYHIKFLNIIYFNDQYEHVFWIYVNNIEQLCA